jgi:hypothetical protein
MKAVIHQPYYLPYPGFFHKLSLGDVFVIMDDVQYDKRFTNRNRIITTNNWTWLTVPINKENKFSPNMEVKINNEIDWKDTHWKKIFHSYKNSSFFNLYSDYFENLYKKEWNYLFELDLDIVKQIINWLGIKVKIIRESELNIKSNSTQRLVDVCKKIGADTYVSGVGGHNYIDEKIFSQNNLNLEYQKYTHPEYPQRMSNSFIPDLSILDMLFNIGPQTMKVITGEIKLDYVQT